MKICNSRARFTLDIVHESQIKFVLEFHETGHIKVEYSIQAAAMNCCSSSIICKTGQDKNVLLIFRAAELFFKTILKCVRQNSRLT